MPRPPKGVLRRAVYNPNARAAKNYSIAEDLAQAPCAHVRNGSPSKLPTTA